MTMQANWHVAYVHARSEKKVAERLVKLQIIHFLPLIKTVRQWSDRKKTVSIPLFNGYIFVFGTTETLTRIRMIAGVVNYIYADGKPAVIAEKEISMIRQFVESGIPLVSADDTFSAGEKVRITGGPLQNTIGELVDVRNEKQFIVRIEFIQQVMMLKIPAGFLEKA